jgi:peptidoglycan-associated lipoprotein
MKRSSIARAAVLGVATAALLTANGCSCGDKPAEETNKRSEFSEGPVDPNEAARRQIAGLEKIYFDYDSAALRSDAKGAIERDAKVINATSGTIYAEGHCDERGNDEYNLALGERRAAAVKKYLTNLGVPDSKLRTVSYGESQPAVQGHDESAWKFNRRVQFSLR